MDVLERHAVLTIRDPEKTHSGPYRLILENELGQDSCVVNIQVNGITPLAHINFRVTSKVRLIMSTLDEFQMTKYR